VISMSVGAAAPGAGGAAAAAAAMCQGRIASKKKGRRSIHPFLLSSAFTPLCLTQRSSLPTKALSIDVSSQRKHTGGREESNPLLLRYLSSLPPFYW
jgi:hypothetical protein